jgi:hypothetical protein
MIFRILVESLGSGSTRVGLTSFKGDRGMETALAGGSGRIYFSTGICHLSLFIYIYIFFFFTIEKQKKKKGKKKITNSQVGLQAPGSRLQDPPPATPRHEKSDGIDHTIRDPRSCMKWSRDVDHRISQG